MNHNSHEERHAVVDFLIGDVNAVKHTRWSGFVEKFADWRGDDLVCDFVVLGQDHESILTLKLLVAEPVVLSVRILQGLLHVSILCVGCLEVLSPANVEVERKLAPI